MGIPPGKRKMYWPIPRTSQKHLNACVKSVSKTVIPASSDFVKCSPTLAALHVLHEFEEDCDSATKIVVAPLKSELPTDIRVQCIAVYDEPADSYFFGYRDQGSLRVEAEDAPEKLFASESERYSTEIGSSIVTVAPSTLPSTDIRLQRGTVCEQQIDRVVKCNLDFSSLILPQSASSLVASDLAAHEQKSATYGVTASLFYPSSSSFKSFSAHVFVLPFLAAAASVSPTCLEFLECGPSNKRNNARKMLKALRHRKAKAKQKAKTDIAYCALLFKANRHRKAITKLKKFVLALEAAFF